MSKAIKEVKAEKSVDMSEVAKELLALRKELENLQKEKKAFSEAEKAAIEDAREDMVTDDELGPLWIDEKYKEEGFSYRIADSNRSGRISQLLRLGYEIVYDEEAQIGQNITGKSSPLTGAVTVELGRDHGSRLGILMRIPKERYDKRQAFKARRNQEGTDGQMQDMVNKSEFGSIEIGSKTYSK